MPPEALEVLLDAFEGPLDLLLYLIRKANVDILDIPMASLTGQYLEYVEQMRRRNLDLAAEYLVMAAVLLEIKSRMLLPRPVHEAHEPDDPRAELVRRLVEYEQMKRAADHLDQLPRNERDFSFVSVPAVVFDDEVAPQVSAGELLLAWQWLAARTELVRHHKISREELSVREYMTAILRRIAGRGFVELLAVGIGRPSVQVVVVTFLAALELAREGLVSLVQDQPMGPLYLKAAIDGS